MDKKEKITKLTKDLGELKKKHQHMLTEYSDTKAGSAYGVEYYDIQVKVLETMMLELQTEISSLRKIVDN